MIDKKISLGTLITIVTILGTFIYTQGIVSNKIESSESSIQENTKSIKTNRTKTQNLEVGQERIETKIDMMLKMMEDL